MGVKLAAGCYFGDRVRVHDVAGFLLTECTYQAGDRLQEHSHERSYFNLVVAGGYAETYGNRSRGCLPATVVFHPGGEVHEERVNREGARLFCVEPAEDWLGEAPEYHVLLGEPADFQGGPLAQLAFCLYREFHRPDPFSPLAVEGLMLEFVAERGRIGKRLGRGRPPLWLDRARELLDARFAASLSLTELAAEVAVHLASSDDPLVEIALAAGFADQSHFSRTFKRLRGRTPAAFRQLHHPMFTGGNYGQQWWRATDGFLPRFILPAAAKVRESEAR